MDAKEFLKALGRMCKQQDNCKECAANKSCTIYTSITPNLELVDVVEKWANEHPLKTNRDALKEKFGTVIFSADQYYTLDHFYANGMSLNDWLNSEYKEPGGVENDNKGDAGHPDSNL